MKKCIQKRVCFNVPFLIKVKTNIGKTFFKLLRKDFHKTSKLYKVFHKNTVKKKLEVRAA